MDAQNIVDSHVHWWDPGRFHYPWLAGMPLLNRPFDPADLAAASRGANIGKWIFVECGCEPAESLAEVDWIGELAKSETRIRGIVAHASLEKGEAARADLEKLAARPLVKGVRRNLQGEARLDFCLAPEFVAGVKLLKSFGYTFDLCVRREQLTAVVELVHRAPEVNFVLDHLGKPDVLNGRLEPWATDLKMLAESPNVACKISGLTTEADWQGWQPADLRIYFDRTLESFGFDRILFGGDWPVATLATSYQRWMRTVQSFLSSVTEADRNKVFHANAERIYRV